MVSATKRGQRLTARRLFWLTFLLPIAGGLLAMWVQSLVPVEWKGDCLWLVVAGWIVMLVVWRRLDLYAAPDSRAGDATPKHS